MSQILPTDYPVAVAASGVGSQIERRCYGPRIYIKAATGSFLLSINGGSFFTAKLGTNYRLQNGLIETFTIKSSGNAVAVVVCISDGNYAEDAIILDGEVSVAAKGWAAWGISNSDVTFGVANGEEQVWTGDAQVDMVFVKHIAGTAPIRLWSTDTGSSPSRGIHLDPGDSLFLPVPLNGSVWAGTLGLSVTLVCSPFYRS